MAGMTQQEALRFIKGYIGVEDGGHLSDFTHRTLDEFYIEFCNLEIDGKPYSGSSKREKFHKILCDSTPDTQAKIIRGILKKCPHDPSKPFRSQQAVDELVAIAQRLEGVAGVASPTLEITSEVVERALLDAEHLIKISGATSGVDRIHTALHGYLKAICNRQRIAFSGDPTINSLFRMIKDQHPAFTTTGPRADDITKITRAMSQVMDVLNPIRNQASVAHPNEELLEEAEAMLVINVVRSILHYLNAKLSMLNSGL
jgi:Abortive infection C-terminus